MIAGIYFYPASCVFLPNCVLYDRIANDNISHTCLKMVLSTYFRFSLPRIVSHRSYITGLYISRAVFGYTLMSPCVCLTRTVLIQPDFFGSYLALIGYKKALKRFIKCSFVRA